MARREDLDETRETVEHVETEPRVAPPPGAAPPGDPELEQGVVHENEVIRRRADGSIERDQVRQVQRRRLPTDNAALWLLLLLLLAAAGLGAWWYFTQATTAEVPAVEGLTLDEATARLSEEGLRADVSTEPSDAREGTVFEQDPAAGTEVDEGSTVALGVSGGPEERPVPNAVGLTESTARDRLVAAGFEVTTREVFADDEPGTVVAQSPAAGADAADGATVTINVSKGTGEVDVPNVVGMSRSEAEAELESAKLEVNAVEVPSIEPEGTVVAQNPAAGTAKQGSTVRINVSSGELP